jgi:hypothetical protein
MEKADIVKDFMEFRNLLEKSKFQWEKAHDRSKNVRISEKLEILIQELSALKKQVDKDVHNSCLHQDQPLQVTDQFILETTSGSYNEFESVAKQISADKFDYDEFLESEYEKTKISCPVCNKKVHKDGGYCPHCSWDFDDDGDEEVLKEFKSYYDENNSIATE